jgi:hypothetical protein
MLPHTLVAAYQKICRQISENMKGLKWPLKERNPLETIHSAESFWRNYALKVNRTWVKTQQTFKGFSMKH